MQVAVFSTHAFDRQFFDEANRNGRQDPARLWRPGAGLRRCAGEECRAMGVEYVPLDEVWTQ